MQVMLLLQLKLFQVMAVSKRHENFTCCTFENKNVNVLRVYTGEHYNVTLASLSDLTQALKYCNIQVNTLRCSIAYGRDI